MGESRLREVVAHGRSTVICFCFFAVILRIFPFINK